MKKAVCLQHVEFEGPGFLHPILTELGYRIDRSLVPRDGLPADAGDFLLVMGGPMSVNDRDEWVSAEEAFIRDAVRLHIPVLGICLGSQFIAKACGGIVEPGPQPEIGMTTLHRTEAGACDPCFSVFPEVFEAFEWHGEGIAVPASAAVLAGSPLFPVQAFRVGPQAYGFLFHVEVEPDGVAALCREGEADLRRARLTQAEVEETAEPHFPVMQSYLTAFMRRLLG